MIYNLIPVDPLHNFKIYETINDQYRQLGDRDLFHLFCQIIMDVASFDAFGDPSKVPDKVRKLKGEIKSFYFNHVLPKYANRPGYTGKFDS